MKRRNQSVGMHRAFVHTWPKNRMIKILDRRTIFLMTLTNRIFIQALSILFLFEYLHSRSRFVICAVTIKTNTVPFSYISLIGSSLTTGVKNFRVQLPHCEVVRSLILKVCFVITSSFPD